MNLFILFILLFIYYPKAFAFLAPQVRKKTRPKPETAQGNSVEPKVTEFRQDIQSKSGSFLYIRELLFVMCRGVGTVKGPLGFNLLSI